MNIDLYKKMYDESISDGSGFFAKQAKELITWDTMFMEGFALENNNPVWFKDGKLNACYNAVDRHAIVSPDSIAFIYSDNDGGVTKYTYGSVLENVIVFSNILIDLGLNTGDCVTLYLSNSPESFFIVLACSRIGVVVNPVFGGFGAKVIAQRIDETKSKLLITTDFQKRGKDVKNYLETSFEAIGLSEGASAFVINTETKPYNTPFKCCWYTDVAKSASYVPCVPMDSTHALFYYYTSGSTGKPKAIVHMVGGYLVETAMSQKYVFDFDKKGIFLCTADIGWLAAYSHAVFGPLLLGGTSIIFAGSSFYPADSRIFDLVEKLKVSHIYTAPTLVRMLRRRLKEANGLVNINENRKPVGFSVNRDALSANLGKIYDLTSLKTFGCVGEPLDSASRETITSYFTKCRNVDTYWQTETGSVMLAPFVESSKFVGMPFFGIKPLIIRKESTYDSVIETEDNKKGYLLFNGCWPSLAKTILGDHERWNETYFGKYEGYYFTGDEAIRDEKGNYRILGRIDDVVNVCGHRMSTAEVENAVARCPGVVESAAVPEDDALFGQRILIFAVPMKDSVEENVRSQIMDSLKTYIGPVAKHVTIMLVKELPKTQTGKIMRRLLKTLIRAEKPSNMTACYNPECLADIGDLFDEKKRDRKLLK